MGSSGQRRPMPAARQPNERPQAPNNEAVCNNCFGGSLLQAYSI